LARKDAKAEKPPFVILPCALLVMDLSPFRPWKFTIPEMRANQRIIHRFSQHLGGFTLISCCGAIAAVVPPHNCGLWLWSKTDNVNNVLSLT
jgi:hypothetical protein